MHKNTQSPYDSEQREWVQAGKRNKYNKQSRETFCVAVMKKIQRFTEVKVKSVKKKDSKVDQTLNNCYYLTLFYTQINKSFSTDGHL